MRLLLASLCALPSLALAQSPYVVYRAEPMALNCHYPSGATAGAAPITKTLADDVTALALYAGQPVTAISTVFYNYNAGGVAFRPRYRFWHNNISGYGPGTYLGPAFTTDGVVIAGNSTAEIIFDITGSGFNLPSTRFWMGVTLDNNFNNSKMATPSELNWVGIMPGQTIRGSSDTNFFRSTAATDLVNQNNPGGAFEVGNLSVSLGIAGQDFHGKVFLEDVVPTAANPRTIQITASSGPVTYLTQDLPLGNPATSDAYWITVPATPPSGATSAVSVRIGGRPFLHKTLNTQTPVPPSAIPESIALGDVNLINGDVDGSGEIDAADIDEVIAAFGQVFPGDSDPYADLDLSAEVDAADIDIVIANFGAVDE